MPYQELTTHDIIIDIPDIQIGETVIKRNATLFNLNYHPEKKRVVLQWIVKHYAKNVDGTTGDYLPFTKDWVKETIADNTSMCDITNGHPIEKTYDTGEVDEQGNPVMDYDPAITYTGQYDFFFNLAENQAVMVNAMIIQFGQLVSNWDN